MTFDWFVLSVLNQSKVADVWFRDAVGISSSNLLREKGSHGYMMLESYSKSA